MQIEQVDRFFLTFLFIFITVYFLQVRQNYQLLLTIMLHWCLSIENPIFLTTQLRSILTR